MAQKNLQMLAAGFLMCLLSLLFVSVKPLADIITSYTCYDRKHKR